MRGQAWLGRRPLVHVGFLKSWLAGGLKLKVVNKVLEAVQLCKQQSKSDGPVTVLVTGEVMNPCLRPPYPKPKKKIQAVLDRQACCLHHLTRVHLHCCVQVVYCLAGLIESRSAADLMPFCARRIFPQSLSSPLALQR